ncbi:roundabout homolog 3-like [Macrobrachium nipponense]|uniref:roundabout homolog 3-like n=1 Tax=Macrobrachium nipponense TaxID=159736 RepID=UPI0030C83ACA
MRTFDSLSLLMEFVFVAILVGLVSAIDETLPVIKEHPSDAVVTRNNPHTLKCSASGASQITWFHDGEKVNPSAHRVLLEVGKLFFLRVSSGKRQNDAGTYWCVASNQYGSTRSNNATLTIASLSSDFLSQPEPQVRAKVGDRLTLACRPPKGTPPPEISWLMEGQEVTNSSRITVTAIGDLIISKTARQDAGKYVCRAQNDAGTRQSTPSTLTVMVPPWFERRPANMTSGAGTKVELVCRANGSPVPDITWRRLDGKIPLGRATVEDNKLILQNVATADSGTYVCEAENEAGTSTSIAILKVVNAPQFTQRPQNTQALSGKEAQLSCQVEGDPKPLLLWRLPTLDRTNLLMKSQTLGRASISQDGQTLTVKEASMHDSGTYSCWGVSSGGAISAQAELIIAEAYPPPVIGVGPQDLVLAPGSIASFLCEVVSEAATPTVSWWYRPAAHLPARQLNKGAMDDPRFTLPDNGALIIKDIRADDAGIYTCKISASTGKVEQEAILRVKEEAKETQQSRLPAPPSKPRILAVNESAVHLTWLPNSQVSSKSGEWYTVEYWREGWDEWRVADTVMSQESCQISDLTPGQVYTFLVRAVNGKGASFPSPWSDPVLTRASPDPNLTIEQLRQARRKLYRPLVTLSDAGVTGPDSVKLSWKFLATTEFVEGVLVYAVSSEGKPQMTTVLGSSSSSHLLRDLQPNTQYTFFIVPFWQSVEGTPSNSYSLITPEDVPVAAPQDVRVTAHEDGSTLITWSPLSATEARGKVTGYQVTLTHNGTQTTEIVQSPWLEARGLIHGRLYTMRVAALTSAGAGPFSAPVLMDAGMGDAQSHHDASDADADGSSVLYAPPQPAWLVYLLVPLIIIFFVATLFYVQRLRHKAPPSNPPNAPALYQDPSIYPAHHSVNMYSEQKLWHPQDSDKESSLSSTRLIQNDAKNEYAEPREQRANEATEPYATTTLLAPDSPRLTHAVPWTRHHSDDSGVQVNWSAFIPPPPACPPPHNLDLGTKLGSVLYTAASQYDNVSGSGSQQYKKPCDDTSEHTYDVYTQVTPIDHREGFLTFTSLQANQKVAVNPQRSNTH